MIRRRLPALLLAAALCLFAGAARCDDFQAGVDQARRGLKAGDAAAVVDGLQRAMAGAWKRLPFTVVNVHLVAAPPAGYGRFIPRVDNVYRPGEPLILYMEPVGFTVVHDQKNGVYRYNISTDFNLVDAWGRVVSGRREFGRFGGRSRRFPDRFPLTFTYNLSGLPPGEYRVETILRDMLDKKQTHTVVTPIRIQGH